MVIVVNDVVRDVLDEDDWKVDDGDDDDDGLEFVLEDEVVVEVGCCVVDVVEELGVVDGDVVEVKLDEDVGVELGVVVFVVNEAASVITVLLVIVVVVGLVMTVGVVLIVGVVVIGDVVDRKVAEVPGGMPALVWVFCGVRTITEAPFVDPDARTPARLAGAVELSLKLACRATFRILGGFMGEL